MSDGRQLTWSVAEGRRGRRWREAAVGEGGLGAVLLFETGPDARFSHLELATRAGLLTLHPEADGTLHGNVVTPGGIRHVVGQPWAEDGCILVEGSIVTEAAIVHQLRHAVPVGASVGRAVLRIDADLGLAVRPARIARLETDTWRIDGGTPFSVTADDLPRVTGGAAWPMELDEPG